MHCHDRGVLSKHHKSTTRIVGTRKLGETVPNKSSCTMFDAIHHVAYVVPDLDQALELFRSTLSMEPEKIWTSEEEGNRYAALRVGDSGAFLELICPTDPSRSKFAAHLRDHGASVHHVAFRDDAMDNTLSTLNNQHDISGTSPIVSSSGWRISFLDTAATQGIGLQLVDGKHGDE